MKVCPKFLYFRDRTIKHEQNIIPQIYIASILLNLVIYWFYSRILYRSHFVPQQVIIYWMLCDWVIFWGSFFSNQWWKSPPTYQHWFGERRWWTASAVLFCAKVASSTETCLVYSCQACGFACHDRLVDCEVFACLHSHCAHERHLLKPLGAKVGRLCQSVWELCWTKHFLPIRSHTFTLNWVFYTKVCWYRD